MNDKVRARRTCGRPPQKAGGQEPQRAKDTEGEMAARSQTAESAGDLTTPYSTVLRSPGKAQLSVGHSSLTMHGRHIQFDKEAQGHRSTSVALSLLQIAKVLPCKEVTEWLQQFQFPPLLSLSNTILLG